MAELTQREAAPTTRDRRAYSWPFLRAGESAGGDGGWANNKASIAPIVHAGSGTGIRVLKNAIRRLVVVTGYNQKLCIA